MEGPLRAQVLTKRDYENLFDILSECERARTPAELGERLLEALAVRLDYRNASFFLGSSLLSACQDIEPIFTGLMSSQREAYICRYRHIDPFMTVAACRDQLIPGIRAATLDQLQPYLVPANLHYLETFLFSSGVRAVLGAEIPGDGLTAALGLQDRTEGRFGALDLARIQLLSIHLGNLLSLHARVPQRPAWLELLTPRECQVASLVAQGRSNGDIAVQLHVGVDTVKKHLGSVLRKSGAANRTQLTASWTPGGAW